MFLKLFSFTKIEKNPATIEKRINEFLEEGHAFKYACQSESVNKSQFFLSLFYDKKKSNIRAKVFKDYSASGLETKINEFLLTGASMKWASQSSATSAIYAIIFYELGKTSHDVKEETQKD